MCSVLFRERCDLRRCSSDPFKARECMRNWFSLQPQHNILQLSCGLFPHFVDHRFQLMSSQNLISESFLLVKHQRKTKEMRKNLVVVSKHGIFFVLDSENSLQVNLTRQRTSEENKMYFVLSHESAERL